MSPPDAGFLYVLLHLHQLFPKCGVITKTQHQVPETATPSISPPGRSRQKVYSLTIQALLLLPFAPLIENCPFVPYTISCHTQSFSFLSFLHLSIAHFTIFLQISQLCFSCQALQGSYGRRHCYYPLGYYRRYHYAFLSCFAFSTACAQAAAVATTHKVKVGKGGLVFEPNDLAGVEPDSLVEFTFFPKVQSPNFLLFPSHC